MESKFICLCIIPGPCFDVLYCNEFVNYIWPNAGNFYTSSGNLYQATSTVEGKRYKSKVIIIFPVGAQALPSSAG